MYFGLSDDQEFFQENIKKFLDDNASVDVIRKIATDHPELQKDIQEKSTDLEFVLGKIQAKQNETIQTVAAQLNPAMMQIINDLIVAKKIQLLLGADQALFF